MEKQAFLVDKSRKFALNIIKICSSFTQNNVLINQLLRSGTSIGANIHEANFASSKADFISKLHIALKECYESEYWIDLLINANILDKSYEYLLQDCLELKKMLVASCKTAKQ